MTRYFIDRGQSGDMKSEHAERPVPGHREAYPDLKTLREERGKTLRGISQTTRIRVAYLDAIESGRFGSLPEQTYAESFIRTYAKELGIESDPVLSSYRRYLRDLAGVEDTKVIAAVESPRRPPVTKEMFRRFRERITFFRWIKARRKVLGWTVFALLVVTALSFLIYNVSMEEPIQSSLSQTQETGPAEKTAPGDVPAAPAEPAKEGGQEGGPAPAAAAKVPLTLVITAKETTWIRVTSDQEPFYEILLQPGDKVERQAENVFALDVGNAGGIEVEFQGKSIGSIGKRGEVVHLVLPESAGP